MAISLGELELKVKANIDEVKSQIQQLDGEQVEVTVSVETEGLTAAETRLKALEGTRTVTVSADTDESVEETKEETDALGGDRQATAKADTDDSVDTTKEAVDALGGDREANAKATEDETVATVQAAIDALGDDQEATAKAVEDESIATVQSSIEALGTDQNSTVTATEDGSVVTALADIEALGEDQDASVSATDDGTIASVQTELDALSEDQSASVDVSDNGTIDAVVADLGTIPETVDVTTTVTQEVTATLTGVDGTSLSALSTSAEGFKTAANTMKDTQTPFQKAVSDFKSHVDELKTNFSSFSGAVTTLGGWVGTLIGGFVSFGESVFNFVLSNAQTADDLMTLSIQTGTTYKDMKYAKWLEDLMDVSASDIVRAARDINTTRESGQEKWDASAAALYSGISYEDSLTMSSYSIAIAAMRGIAQLPEDQWEVAANDAFGGRSGQLLKPMIAGMASGSYDYYVNEFETNPLYQEASSQETGATLVEVKDAYNRVQNAWDAITDLVAKMGAPAVTDVLDTLADLLESISEIMLDNSLTPEQKGDNIWETIKGSLEGLWKNISMWFEGIWDLLGPTLETLWNFIAAMFSDLFNAIYRGAPNWVKDIIDSDRKFTTEEIIDAGTDVVSKYGYSGTIESFMKNATPEQQQEMIDVMVGKATGMSGYYALNSEGIALVEELLRTTDKNFIGEKLRKVDWSQYGQTEVSWLRQQQAESHAAEEAAKSAAAAEQAAAEAAEAAETVANSEVKMDVNVENNISIRGNDVVVEDVGTSTEVEEYKKKKAATHQYSSAAAHATGNY